MASPQSRLKIPSTQDSRIYTTHASMPLRPFPFPIHVGTDICSISRLSKLYKTRGVGLLKKFLTPRERAEFQNRFATSGLPPTHRIKAATTHGNGVHEAGASPDVIYLAGRWAAKEAAIKAVKPRKLVMKEIEIWSFDAGPVAVILDSVPSESDPHESEMGSLHEMSREEFENVSGQIARVSISHDADCAVATVLAVEESNINGTGDVGGEARAREV